MSATGFVESQHRARGARISLVGCAMIALGVVLASSAGFAQTTPSAPATPEAELQAGIALTRQGRFAAAIPHLEAARGRVQDEFAADFDLALCYVATGENEGAIALLRPWSKQAGHAAQVHDLLAQAQIGAGHAAAARAELKAASAAAPNNERLYVLAADACADHHWPELGLEVVAVGLQHLPRSARLHYERGVFLSELQQSDGARQEFARARALDPHGAIGALAATQAALLEGQPEAAAAAARTGLVTAPHNYILQTLLGQALLKSGAQPGQQAFTDARAALVEAVAARPDFAPAQLALGQAELLEGHAREAVAHLEAARRLDPNATACYALLASAYRQMGDLAQARAALAALENVNQHQVARYKSAPASYVGAAPAGGTPHH